MSGGAPRRFILLHVAFGLAILSAWASPSRAADPLTPVIGVNPQALDFGVLEPGACSDDVVELRNAADDPQSQLVITQLTVTPPFSLVDPPTTPFTIPGDGTSIVALTVRYCASGAGPQIGALTITATHASNSPLLVPLEGVSNTPPSCDAGGPYAGVTGVPIAMTGAGSSDPDGTIVAYRWDFGDGYTGSGVTPIHYYLATGTFDVTLTVTDNWEVSRACTTSAEVGLPNEPPICDAGGPYIGIVGQPVAFDGSGSNDPDGKIVAYTWQFGDCGTATGSNPEHAYELPGSYTIELCVSDDDGGSTCCTTLVDIGPPPGSAPRRSPQKRADESRPAGFNPNITLPLHAGPGCSDCSSSTVNCTSLRPQVNILPNINTTVYLMAMNHFALAGVQTAFLWDPSWMFLGAAFDCVPGQASTLTPSPPGGATAGTVATTFNCVTGPQLLVIGRLLMKSGPTGCLLQVQSTYPFGTHAIDCSLGIDLIREDARLGKICVAAGGMDACDPIAALEPTTWGRVKATYR